MVGNRLGAVGALLLVCVLPACGSTGRDVDLAPPVSSAPMSTVGPSTRVPQTGVPAAFVWPTVNPREAGFDTKRLLDDVKLLESADSDLHALVVVRDGAVALDASLHPYPGGALHDLASVTKSITALVLATAAERGDIEGLNQPLAELVGATAGQPAGSVTIGDLLGMRAGLACGIEPGEVELGAMLDQADPVAYAAGLPAAVAPGASFAYCSPGYHLASAALSQATGMSLADYADEVLFGPLGIEEWRWAADPSGVNHGWGDLALRPADLARIGQLILDGGEWQGVQVIPSPVVRLLAAEPLPVDADFGYGLGWWLPRSMDGAMMARGRGGQFLVIWPRKELVLAGTGAGTDGSVIADFITADLSDTPVAADEELEAELIERLEGLAGPPSAVVPPSGGVPISPPLSVEANPMGVEQVALAVDGVEATMTIEVGGQSYPIAVGLDGVPRSTDRSPVDGTLASVGDWEGTTWTIDVEQADGPNHWVFELNLGDAPSFVVTDRTGLFPNFAVAMSTVGGGT